MPQTTSHMIAVALLMGLTGPAAMAQTQERVRFEAGNDNAAVGGTVVGNGYVDYLLGAQAGQTMAVSLIPGESSGFGTVYFNILPPGSTGEAIYNGSLDGLDATGVALPVSGDYTIRVYQMGNDADAGATTDFTVSVGIQ